MRRRGGRPTARTVLLALLGLYLLFVYVPMVMVAVSAFNQNRLAALPWRGFTLQWFGNITAEPGLLDALRNSLIVGIAVAVSATTLGALAAYGLRRREFRGQGAVFAFLASPLAVPWVLLGLGFLIFFNAVGFPQGLAAVWIAHTTFAAPLAFMIIRPSVNALAANLEEAASDLGATAPQTLLTVILPLLVPALIAAGLLTFTLSLDEFIMAWFVSGFDYTLPVRIWSSLKQGISPSISAISLIMLCLSMTALVVALALYRRRTV
jgi:spermidine/putrescine transport system permease protein